MKTVGRSTVRKEDESLNINAELRTYVSDRVMDALFAQPGAMIDYAETEKLNSRVQRNKYNIMVSLVRMSTGMYKRVQTPGDDGTCLEHIRDIC